MADLVTLFNPDLGGQLANILDVLVGDFFEEEEEEGEAAGPEDDDDTEVDLAAGCQLLIEKLGEARVALGG